MECIRGLIASSLSWRCCGSRPVCSRLSKRCAKVLSLICWFEDLKAAHESLVHGHHRTGVVKLAAVIWRTKQCYKLATLEEFVAVLDDLMRSADQIDVVLLIELAHDVLSESETNATVIITVVFNSSLRVGPQQVTEETRVGHISRTHNILDLVQVLELGTQTTVHAEDLLVDQRSHGQAIKDVAKDTPESDGVASLALIVEAVDAIDLGTLVIASQQKEVLRVLDLVAEKQADRFDGLFSPVNVVTKEQIVGLRGEASVLKDSQQIVVLAVHVTCS